MSGKNFTSITVEAVKVFRFSIKIIERRRRVLNISRSIRSCLRSQAF